MDEVVYLKMVYFFRSNTQVQPVLSINNILIFVTT